MLVLYPMGSLMLEERRIDFSKHRNFLPKLPGYSV